MVFYLSLNKSEQDECRLTVPLAVATKDVMIQRRVLNVTVFHALSIYISLKIVIVHVISCLVKLVSCSPDVIISLEIWAIIGTVAGFTPRLEASVAGDLGLSGSRPE